MRTTAVVIERPEHLALKELELTAAAAGDVVVDIAWSGISTGTERLLWSGRMPSFPGMGYPLVPGYESVGEVVEAGPVSGLAVGERVFVPGARCYTDARGLFGGAASRVVVSGDRVRRVAGELGEEATLLALAATARHAIRDGLPELVVGHGVLGRLVARLTVAAGGTPVVWETARARHAGAVGYEVRHPDDDDRRDYARICDVSGDAGLLDTLIARLAPGGEVVLAGFYAEPLAFAFPPAFMKEARLRVAAEWRDADLAEVQTLLARGALDLAGLITHRVPAAEAERAYRTAFTAPDCLKMVLDWRTRR
ncbi:MAG: chlorophyll synthesis pathway protein BchC [Alphaproteobacteria bacterium]